MEVILKQDVNKIGKAGAIVNVKDGFARNFLMPNNLAVPASAVNLKKLEEDRLKKSAQAQKIKQEAEELKAKILNLSLTMPVLTQEEDKLYGSITAQDLSKLLKDEGFEVDKSRIMLDDPIKALGIYEVPVELHPEVSAKIKVWIVKK